jgi:hypothetical protein
MNLQDERISTTAESKDNYQQKVIELKYWKTMNATAIP